MSQPKPGRRHQNLLYYRTMDRVWGVSLFAGLFTTAWLVGIWYGILPPQPPLPRLLSIGGTVVLFAFTLFALITRRMGFFQARRDHLLIGTPFLRLKIGYKRIKGIRPSPFGFLSPPETADWGTRHFLEPFYAKTALVLELYSMPVARAFLKLFLAPQMFIPKTNNLVILVEDWMVLSTEIESRRGTARPLSSAHKPSAYSLLKDLRKK